MKQDCYRVRSRLVSMDGDCRSTTDQPEIRRPRTCITKVLLGWMGLGSSWTELVDDELGAGAWN